MNSELLVVKVVYDEIDTSQRLEKSDFFFHEEICSLTFENFVRLFLDNDYNIAWLVVGMSI